MTTQPRESIEPILSRLERAKIVSVHLRNALDDVPTSVEGNSLKSQLDRFLAHVEKQLPKPPELKVEEFKQPESFYHVNDPPKNPNIPEE